MVGNSLCYFAICIIFYGNILYYIINKNEGESFKYFILLRHEKCAKHNSTTCGCPLTTNIYNLLYKKRKSIDCYSICSSFFEFLGYKLTFINLDTKFEFLNYYQNSTYGSSFNSSLSLLKR